MHICIVDILSLSNNPDAPYVGLIVHCGPEYQYECIYGMYVSVDNKHSVHFLVSYVI